MLRRQGFLCRTGDRRLSPVLARPPVHPPGRTGDKTAIACPTDRLSFPTSQAEYFALPFATKVPSHARRVRAIASRPQALHRQRDGNGELLLPLRDAKTVRSCARPADLLQ